MKLRKNIQFKEIGSCIFNAYMHLSTTKIHSYLLSLQINDIYVHHHKMQDKRCIRTELDFLRSYAKGKYIS